MDLLQDNGVEGEGMRGVADEIRCPWVEGCQSWVMDTWAFIIQLWKCLKCCHNKKLFFKKTKSRYMGIKLIL